MVEEQQEQGEERHQWQGAYVGADSEFVTMRVTREEAAMIEELRGNLRLTSKGQALRWLIDTMELISPLVEWNENTRQETREIAAKMRGRIAKRHSRKS